MTQQCHPSVCNRQERTGAYVRHVAEWLQPQLITVEDWAAETCTDSIIIKKLWYEQNGILYSKSEKQTTTTHKIINGSHKHGIQWKTQSISYYVIYAKHKTRQN